MTDIIQVFISGLSRGAVFGIVGLTLSLIYNTSKIIHFTQGTFCMLGAVVGFILLARVGLPIWATPIICMSASALAGFILYKLVLSPMSSRGSPILGLIVATIASAAGIAQLVLLTFGALAHHVPPVFKQTSMYAKGVAIPIQDLVIVIVTALLAVGLFLFLRHTRIGRSIRITGINPTTAELMGVNTRLTTGLTFALGGGIAGLAGLLIGPMIGAHALMGDGLLINGFVAALLGGLINPFAPLVGGVIVGEIYGFVSFFFGTAYSPLVLYILLIGILLVRPLGIFGQREE